MGSRTRVMKIGQNVWQLACYFHTPVYSSVIQYVIHVCQSVVMNVTRTYYRYACPDLPSDVYEYIQVLLGGI